MCVCVFQNASLRFSCTLIQPSSKLIKDLWSSLGDTFVIAQLKTDMPDLQPPKLATSSGLTTIGGKMTFPMNADSKKSVRLTSIFYTKEEEDTSAKIADSLGKCKFTHVYMANIYVYQVTSLNLFPKSFVLCLPPKNTVFTVFLLPFTCVHLPTCIYSK